MSDRNKSTTGTEFAWKVHTALDSWTGKVDTKASIALAIESAVFGFVVSLSKAGERFSSLKSTPKAWYDIGVVLLLGAIFWALLVVLPQLNRRQSRKNWRAGIIYFGHLRHWDPEDLERELKRAEAYESQLAAQLVAMSKIAWKKHARLQWSVLCFVLSAAALVLASLLR